MDALAAFHPAVRTWFERRFPLGPSEPEGRGWPPIAGGRDTLISTPESLYRLVTAGKSHSTAARRILP